MPAMESNPGQITPHPPRRQIPNGAAGSTRTEANFQLASLSVKRALGPLEAEVMDVVWNKEKVTVRDVHEVLSKEKPIAYTTVLSTMSNLARNGLLERRRRGKAHAYSAAFTRAELTESKVGQIVDALLDGFMEAATQHFIGRLSREDPGKLAQLEKLLAAKRTRLTES